jgi:hypothetical protein
VAVNRDKVDQWKADVATSVDFYNAWFMAFAPGAFRETRVATTRQFDSGYLGYESAEGIDWVWEHRIDDLAEFGF